MDDFRVTSAIAYHNTKVKVYPNGRYHVTCFTRDIFNDGWEDIRPKYKREKQVYDLLNPRDDSMKRAKGKIFDIALSNSWDYMVTLTLDGSKIDRYNTKEIIKPFCIWLNNMVKRKGLKYLIVPEYHEDGAIHFHGLINDSLDLSDSGTVKVPDRKKPIKIATAKKYGYDLNSDEVRTVWNIDNYKLGFSTAVHIDDNVEAVSKYMTKYTCKNFQKIFGQSFFAGGGVRREPDTFYLDIPYNRFLTGNEYKLPENLGAVKYAVLTEETFQYFLCEVGF